jgi:hypothetical protein
MLKKKRHSTSHMSFANILIPEYRIAFELIRRIGGTQDAYTLNMTSVVENVTGYYHTIETFKDSLSHGSMLCTKENYQQKLLKRAPTRHP